MAHDGTGTGWTITDPADGDDITLGAREIRDLRRGVAIRADKEHVAAAVGSAGGEHKNGSAKAYFANVAPTTRPDGTSAFTADDSGRLWVNSSTLSLYVLQADGSFAAVVPPAGALTPSMVVEGFLNDIYSVAHLVEFQTTNTNGGSASTGWQTRVLNRKDDDPVSFVSLNTGTGQITLPAGRYSVEIRGSGYQVGAHQTRLRNVTDSTTVVVGSSARAPVGVDIVTESVGFGYFTISSTKVFELQHYCNSSRSGDGLGKAAASSGVEERYASVKIWKHR